MVGRPLVSVVMPLFNSRDHIRQAIASVATQTMPDWELVIVDDGSTDGSDQIVEAIAAECLRIALIRQGSNKGAASARNAATDQATGRYIAFLDADDLWDPQKLEKQVRFAATEGHSFTHTWYRRIGPGGSSLNKVMRAPPRLSYRANLRANRVGCLTAMYDVERLGKVFVPDIRKRNDYALWLALLKRTEYAYCLPEELASYRVTPGSLSWNKRKLIKYHYRLFREVEGLSAPASAFYVACNVVSKLGRG